MSISERARERAAQKAAREAAAAARADYQPDAVELIDIADEQSAGRHRTTWIGLGLLALLIIVGGLLLWNKPQTTSGNLVALNDGMSSGFAAAQEDRDVKHDAVMNAINEGFEGVNDRLDAVEGELATLKGACRLDKPCEQESQIDTAVCGRHVSGTRPMTDPKVNRSATLAERLVTVNGVTMHRCVYHAPVATPQRTTVRHVPAAPTQTTSSVTVNVVDDTDHCFNAYQGEVVNRGGGSTTGDWQRWKQVGNTVYRVRECAPQGQQPVIQAPDGGTPPGTKPNQGGSFGNPNQGGSFGNNHSQVGNSMNDNSPSDKPTRGGSMGG